MNGPAAAAGPSPFEARCRERLRVTVLHCKRRKSRDGQREFASMTANARAAHARRVLHCSKGLPDTLLTSNGI